MFAKPSNSGHGSDSCLFTRKACPILSHFVASVDGFIFNPIYWADFLPTSRKRADELPIVIQREALQEVVGIVKHSTTAEFEVIHVPYFLSIFLFWIAISFSKRILHKHHSFP